MFLPLPLLRINTHPLFSSTLAFMAGIIGYRLIQHARGEFMVLTAIVTCIGLLMLVAAVCRYWKSFLIGAAFLAGSGRLYQYHQVHERFYTTLAAHQCDIVGTVVDQTELDHPRFCERFTLRIATTSLALNNELRGQELECYVTTHEPDAPSIRVGDTLMLSGCSLRKPSSDSFKEHLWKKGIQASLFSPQPACKLLDRPVWSLQRSIHEKRRELFSSLAQRMSVRTSAFFASLFLGNKTHAHQELEHMKDIAKHWGISHVLARSGLHLLIFLMGLQALLALFPIHARIRHLTSCALTAVYYILSFSSVSFLRSFCACMLHSIGLITQHQVHTLHILSLICLGMLMHTPLLLFFLDFQLSFGLTGALLWFNLVNRHRIKRLAKNS